MKITLPDPYTSTDPTDLTTGSSNAGYIFTQPAHHQTTTYPDCGCTLSGLSPLPLHCPTHGVQGPRVTAARVTTILGVVLDESGSMNTIKDRVIAGYNEYFNGLRRDPSSDYLVTLVKFDAMPPEPNCRVQYNLKAIQEAPDLNSANYQPRGSTPLYDAIGETIRQIEKEASRTGYPVLLVINTDGQENASREFNQDSIAKLIKEKEATGKWTFVYLGADQNAWAHAQKMGMSAGNTVSYSSSNVRSVMNSLVGATYTRSENVLRGASATMCFFADAESNPSYNLGGVVGPAVTVKDLASLGGISRNSKISPEKRKAIAKKAIKARWDKKTPGASV